MPRPAESAFDRVVERAISRRGCLGGVPAFGSGAAVIGTSFLKGSTAMAQGASRFPFEAIGIATDATVHVPEGDTCKARVRWGDALKPEAMDARDPAAGVSVEMSEMVFGETADGMELYTIDGREILVVISAYTHRPVNLPHAEGGTSA